jgi:hypothetical protein
MKLNYLSNVLAFLTCASMTVSTSSVLAQEAAATAAAPATTPATTQTTAQATTPAAPTARVAPQLAYGAAQILQLAQAKVGDDTIISYIKNSGNSYALSVDQIIYLQQQGLSTPVLNAMLSQPKAAGLAYLPPAAMPMPADNSATDAQPAPDPQQDSSTVSVGPPVTAIDPTAAAAYAYPYYPYPYYYPAYGYYGFYPGVAVSIGWGGYGWRGGGYRGGNFRGGGVHGGGFHGGFHH